MVEKLTKYNVEMCHCFLGEHMETVESSDGEFFKVEDMEPILNSLQQLKAEIRAEVERFASKGHWQKDSDVINVFVAKLRELSAV